MKCNTGFSPSLKATAERRQEIEDDDPISGLKRAQADYEDARAGFRNRQRQILQNVFKSVSDLIDDAAACRKFMKDKAFGKYDCTPVADGDRADVWFRALAYVYRATSRAKRQRASKHASALLAALQTDADAKKIAATIEKRGGLQKLADEAAKARRKGSKQSVSRHLSLRPTTTRWTELSRVMQKGIKKSASIYPMSLRRRFAGGAVTASRSSRVSLGKWTGLSRFSESSSWTEKTDVSTATGSPPRCTASDPVAAPLSGAR